MNLSNLLQPESIQVLLECTPALKENLNMPCNESAPLYIAALEGHTEVVNQLMKYLPPNGNLNIDVHLNNESKSTPLLAACEGGFHEIVKTLIDNQANINYKEVDTGLSGLLIASQFNNVEVIRELLKYNHLNVYDTSLDLCTALYIAAENNSEECIDLLLDFNPPASWVNAQNQKGRTPLFISCSYGFIDVAKALIEKNANVNLPDKKGVTPLFIAAQQNFPDVCELLLTAHADPNIGRGEEGATPLHIAAALNHIESLAVLIKHAPDINIVNEDGVTPLFSACEENQLEAIQMLLNAGANANQLANDGTSPLLVACEESVPDCVVSLLLSYDADPLYRTEEGASPYDFKANYASMSSIFQSMSFD